jgi:RimJ/RimL family protein N-acetyltransferase
MPIVLKKVITKSDIEAVAALADIIWREHYTPIIGAEQVAYMLENFQSYDAINHDVKNAISIYYLVMRESEAVGYIGIKLDMERVFLSKIYIHSDQRGKGVGKQTLEAVKDIARSKSLNEIHLTVNKYNTNSIEAYKKFGFIVTGDVCADIGEGYVMDDYTMELTL